MKLLRYLKLKNSWTKKKVRQKKSRTKKNEDPPDDASAKPKTQGTMILDATCAPQDITFPTDLKLLNSAREKSEEIIDTLYKPLKGHLKKPRTYRKKARKHYLALAKKKRKTALQIKAGIAFQLRCLARNFRHIETLIKSSSLEFLSKRQYKNLLVIREIYRQQKTMLDENKHSIKGRIVSVSQPHVRPIVRGKARAKVEFGSKVSVQVVKGFSFLDRLSWEAYNEGQNLAEQAATYKKRFGFYPAVIQADPIYITRLSRNFCKNNNIRLSGKPLGHPPKDETKNKALEKIKYQDSVERIEIEGKFGVSKRRFGLNLIMCKLAITSAASVALTVIALSLYPSDFGV